MKLVITIVQSDDADHLVKNMVKEKFYATKLSSKGGFLSKSNVTILVGVDEERLDDALEVIKNTCQARKSLILPEGYTQEIGFISTGAVEISVGGATVFVVDVDQFYKF